MERNHAPAPRRGVTLSLFVESVFNYRVFDVVFIHIDRCQEAGGQLIHPDIGEVDYVERVWAIISAVA